ncbi:MAG: caspase family protein, partial [Planctomycetes bacterium]|nr:caspase family protein [Planctomycetota bacterium]
MSDKAVLFGINDYKSISDLRGCVNDVRNDQSLLVDVFDFPSPNVRVFTDREVTKDRIRKQWRWLLDNASEGDRLVFHFSGH